MLQDFIESVAFRSTNALKDQQLTQDGIPVQTILKPSLIHRLKKLS